MKKNNKAFTLVELLLVIVIISIVTLLVLPNISDILTTSKNKKWTTIEDLVKTNLELYNIDHLEDLWCTPYIDTDGTEYTCPEEETLPPEIKITINDLLEVNPDIELDICEVNYLNIKKNSSNNFTYEVCIKCGEEYNSDKYYNYCKKDN